MGRARATAVSIAMLAAVAGLALRPAPASASECTIPGSGVATVYHWNPATGQQHRGCARMLYQPVPGNPSICFESWWAQELTDGPNTDATWFVLSRATDYTGQWFSSPGYDRDSFDWVPASGWRTVPRHPTYGCTGGMFAFRVSFTTGTPNVQNITPVYG